MPAQRANKLQINATKSRGRSRAKSEPARRSTTGSTVVKCPIVGIGASAGGYEAVAEFLTHMQGNTGLAFVIVQHLDPSHRSALPEMLARATRLPVVEIPARIRVQPNRVYVLPSNKYLTLDGCILKLSERTRSTSSAIDLFFESLAREQAGRAIGVVMSGTGSDGTLGLGAIKDAGGLTFVQSEETAKFTGMPRSALQAGCVDAALSPRALAGEIARIARHPHVHDHPGERDGPLPEHEEKQPDDEMAKIFAILKHHSGVDFSRYKQSTVQRRVHRRMVLRGLKKLDEYGRLLRKSPDETDRLFSDLLINVTQFFRDKGAFQSLKRRFLPVLIKRKGAKGDLRAWVPGCATGEEVYSLAICILEALPAKHRMHIQIFGTDLSEAALSRARAGVYSGIIAKDVSASRLKRFFQRTDSGYQVNRSVRDLCTFARQNVTNDAPFSRLDLISCRNLLIYLGPEMQKKCLPVFHYALNAGGYLMLGPSESIGAFSNLFDLADKRNKIYIRKTTATRPRIDFSTVTTLESLPLNYSTRRDVLKHDVSAQLQQTADRVTLRQYAPSGAVIDSNFEVVQFRGNTNLYLEHPAGAASLNLLQMARPSLVPDLRVAIHRALKRQQPIRKENAVAKYDGKVRIVNIHVFPLQLPVGEEKWLLVLFQEAKPLAAERKETRTKGPRGKESVDARELKRLRSELDATKESLQAIIEEQEATNEELRSANEEIESSNEELQSTNEELETAKEELQSTNEELTTLNEELSTRNLEMIQINNDLNNLLSSTNLPIVMVDNDLTIRRATPMAREPFNIIESDVGRRLSDLKSRIDLPDLDELLHEVLATLEVREREVRDQHGRWYSLRIQPYRTGDSKIDGAVITLIDITADKKSIALLEAGTEYAEAIVETVREPMLVLDGQLRVQKANRSFYQLFNVDPRATEQKLIYKIGKGQWDIPELRRLLERILPRRTHFENFKVEGEFPEIGKRTILLNARRLDNKGENLILLAMADVTKNQPFSRSER